jgi:hypothetical protein
MDSVTSGHDRARCSNAESAERHREKPAQQERHLRKIMAQ